MMGWPSTLLLCNLRSCSYAERGPRPRLGVARSSKQAQPERARDLERTRLPRSPRMVGRMLGALGAPAGFTAAVSVSLSQITIVTLLAFTGQESAAAAAAASTTPRRNWPYLGTGRILKFNQLIIAGV
eukprot:SAG11_NODE_843_length_6892_cov_31.379803_6_plen_128_part_00